MEEVGWAFRSGRDTNTFSPLVYHANGMPAYDFDHAMDRARVLYRDLRRVPLAPVREDWHGIYSKPQRRQLYQPGRLAGRVPLS